MMVARIIRYCAWAAVAAIAFVVAVVAMYDSPLKLFGNDKVAIGGPFEMIDGNGNIFTEQDILGKPTLIFFGFTYCPDICPTTLAETQGWIDQLGSDSDSLNFLFVTVDPERDTPEVMKDYMSSFSNRIVPLTGTPEQVAGMIDSYRVYARKVETQDGDYTMDHSAGVYLMDSNNSFVGMISYGENPENSFAKIRKLIDNS